MESLQSLPQASPPSAAAPRYALGQRLTKYFAGHGHFKGTIDRLPDATVPAYHVTYDDGDGEDLTEDAIGRLLQDAAGNVNGGGGGGVAAMELDEPATNAAAATGSRSTAGAAAAAATSAAGPPKSDPFADEVERIVQLAEEREYSGGGIGGGAAAAAAAVTSPAGEGKTGGPLTANEIARLTVLCASLEDDDSTNGTSASAAGGASGSASTRARKARQAPPKVKLTDAERSPHKKRPDDVDSDASSVSSDYCPTLRGWASVDGDVLMQLVPMLEKHVRSAAGVDLIAEARTISEAHSSDKKKNEKKNGALSVDKWISVAGNSTPHGISYPGSGHHRLELIRRGLEAASILLAIVTSHGVDQRAISEDAIESCVAFLRQHLMRNVMPSISGTGHLVTSASGASGGNGESSATDSHITPRKGKRAKKGEGDNKQMDNLEKDLKKAYTPILTTLGLLSVLMERVELLIRTVQLEDQQLMSICSASLSTMTLEPSQTTNRANVANAHVVQIAAISLVTAIFRRYRRHRTIVVEDLFPLMLSLPTSKRYLRTYSVKSVASLKTMEFLDAAAAEKAAKSASIALKSPAPSASASRRRSSSAGAGAGGGAIGEQGHIQMMSALFLHLVQACVTMPVAVAPKVSSDDDDDEEMADGSSAAAAGKGSWDMPTLTSGTADCEAVVNLFVNEFAKRCAKKGEEGGASEFKPVLGNFVEDLLQVRFDPEFPAADMLLHAFCRKLTQDLLRCSSVSGTDRNSRATAEVTYLTTAFNIIGTICASIGANRRAQSESPLVLPEATDVADDQELAIDKTGVKCFCGRSNLTDVFMVDCDRCHGWFHGSCVSITKENAPNTWLCDDCTLQVIVMEESKDFASRNNRRKRSKTGSATEGADNTPAGNDSSIDDVYIMRQLLLNFLSTMQSPMTKAAREYHLAKWIQECEEARGSSNKEEIIEAEVKESTYLDLWHVPSHEQSDIISQGKKYLSDEGNVKLMESLAAIKSDLTKSFPRLIGVIITLMGDPKSANLRKNAVQTILNIMYADNKIMHRKEVTNAVALRFRDDAISVREKAVSLVGTFALQSPNVAAGFHPLLLEKLHDEGISVRKTAVKILRDLMLTNPDYPGRAAACSVLLKLAADPKEDDNVRDLIWETFQALWFDTAKVALCEDDEDNNSKSTRRRNKMVASASEHRLVSAAAQMVEVVAWSEGKSEPLAKLVKELLFGLGEGGNKAGARKRRHEAAQSHCSKIVAALIEQLLTFEDAREKLDKQAAGQKLVAIMATLEVFAECSAALLIEHLDTILPYLKAENGVSRDDEAAIAASVCKIISRSSQCLTTTDAERLGGGIVKDLGKVINRLGSNAMSAAIEALSRLAAHPGAGSLPETELLSLAKAFYSFLHRARDMDISKLKASKRGMVHRALSALGAICRFHEFEEQDATDSIDVTDIAVPDPSEMELDWTNIVPSCYALFSLYLQKEYAPTKSQALRGMNGIFIANPRLMLAVEQEGVIADVMSEKSGVDLQLAALQCWRELLICEEKRVESGEAREQMEAKEHITVSKRISGDQDEDASLVGGVMSQHSKRFYQMLMSRDIRVRARCLDLVGDLLRQGLINPIQTIPFLLALQGDVGAPDIRAKALKLLVTEGEKRPDSLRQRVKMGCKEAFNFQRKVYPERPTTAVIERNKGGLVTKVECIFDKIFIESIRSSKVQRHGLFISLLSLFEVDIDTESKGKSTGRARKLLQLQAFAAQVLATLPYTNISDALFINYHANARLSDAEMFAEKMADFLRPYGLAPEDIYDILDDDEDDIEEAAKAKEPCKCDGVAIMSTEGFDLETFADLCASASALVLLLKLKRHLKGAFHLQETRMKDYLPSERDRPTDKGHVSSASGVFSISLYVTGGGSKVDDCINRYAEWRKEMRNVHLEEVEAAKSNSKRKRSGSSSSAGDDDDDGDSEEGSAGESEGEEMEA